MTQTFFNTTGLTGPALKEAVTAAKTQDEQILLIYKNTRKSFSPWQILNLLIKAGKNPPITSVRRSITNLTKSGDLVMTGEQVLGEYNRPENIWQINFLKYPSNPGTQQKLF